jgi:hypothetical protein
MPLERVLYFICGASMATLAANPAIAPWLIGNNSVSIYHTTQNSVTPLSGTWIVIDTEAPMHANLYALPACKLIYGVTEGPTITSVYKNTLGDLSDLQIIRDGFGSIVTPTEPAYA